MLEITLQNLKKNGCRLKPVRRDERGRPVVYAIYGELLPEYSGQQYLFNNKNAKSDKGLGREEAAKNSTD